MGVKLDRVIRGIPDTIVHGKGGQMEFHEKLRQLRDWPVIPKAINFAFDGPFR